MGSVTQAVEQDLRRLGSEREELELKLAENLRHVNDLETSVLVCGEYLHEANERAFNLDRVLKVGHGTGVRHKWTPMDIEEPLNGLDISLGAADQTGATMPVQRSRRGSKIEESDSSAPQHAAVRESFQDVQDDFREVKGHPQQIEQE